MSLVSTELTPLDIMFELVLEDGRLWGEVATDLQIDDVEAIFSPDGPNKHFETRPRGGSKTSDAAGAALAWLRAGARPRAHGFVVAANADQAAVLVDAAHGFVDRTPELDCLTVENFRILNEENGASVVVLPASESGAWGKFDAHFIVCDEFAQWPETRGAKRVWTAVRTTVQKTPGCQLLILTSAGEPSHWSYPIFQNAKTGRDGWRVSEMPGPVPWQDKAELKALENELEPSEYERLILNQWSEAEDRGISEEDWEAAKVQCVKIGSGRKLELRTRPPQPGERYVILVDIGTVNDATVIGVMHAEPFKQAQGVVVDHLVRWQGTKRAPVKIADVEERVAELSYEYNRAKVHADPVQFVGSLQNLNLRGVKAEEFKFTATSVGEVATALVQTFRNQLIQVPDAPVLKDELLKVRLRESSPGVSRLDHDRSGHDDQAVVIGMGCFVLLGRAVGSFAAFKAYIAYRREQSEQRVSDSATGQSFDESAPGRFLANIDRQRQRRERAELARQQRCQHRWQVSADGSAICVWNCRTRRTADGRLIYGDAEHV